MRTPVLGAGVLLVGLAALAALGRASPPVTVTALEYGRARFPIEDVFAGAPPGKGRGVSFQAWLVRTRDRLVLVDTGFVDPERARQWGVTAFVPVARLLRRELGVDPADVTDVVLTHGHWDHAGGVRDFPGARVWIQAAELRWMAERLRRDPAGSSGVLPADVEALRAHRGLVEVRGEGEVAPEVRLHRGGGHTPGSQWVEVRSDPPIVLAGDVVFVGESLERDVSTPFAHDAAAERAARGAMRAVPGARVVPGHEAGTTGGRAFLRLAPPLIPGG